MTRITDHEESRMSFTEDTMEHLDVDPGETDMEWVYANAHRKKLSWITAVLALGVAAAIGFVGGVRVQKSEVKTTAATSGTGRRAGAAGTAGAGAAGVGGAAAAGRTIGTVKLIDGTNLYVTDTSGNVVKVATTGASFTKTDSGSVSDIHPGDTVVVTGSTGSDGTVNARSVVEGGAAGAGGGGFGGFGGRGGGGGGAGAAGGATTGTAATGAAGG
jgi:hypothetical protein